MTALLYRGNRTEIELISPPGAAAYVRKRLRRFADVGAERRALRREGELQKFAAGDGVVEVTGGALDVEGHPSSIEDDCEWRVLCRSYVDAPTLLELRQSRGPLVPEEAYRIGAQLAAILQRLHGLGEGLVHRDVTPTNVYLTEKGEVLLNDFGLARLMSDPPLEDDELLQGSRPFLPPELGKGEQATEKSDVFQASRLIHWLMDRAETESFLALGRENALSAALLANPSERPTAAELVSLLVRSGRS